MMIVIADLRKSQIDRPKENKSNFRDKKIKNVINM